MTAIGKVIKGRSRAVRCDGCGRISSDRDQGYYVDKSGKGGNITGKGRECRHDFCDQCDAGNPEPPECPKCDLFANYWTEAEARAASEVHPIRCIHGEPRNVYCGKCEG